MEKKETMIQAEDLVYEYRKYDEEGRERELIKAVNGVSFQIEKGGLCSDSGTQRFRKIYAGQAYQRPAYPQRGNSVGGWN